MKKETNPRESVVMARVESSRYIKGKFASADSKVNDLHTDSASGIATLNYGRLRSRSLDEHMEQYMEDDTRRYNKIIQHDRVSHCATPFCAKKKLGSSRPDRSAGRSSYSTQDRYGYEGARSEYDKSPCPFSRLIFVHRSV